MPYIGFLGVTFDRRGDELTAVLNYDDKADRQLRCVPALHGGAIASFLEVTAIMDAELQHALGRRGGGGASTPIRSRPRPCRGCPRPSTSPSITCAPACRAMPMARARVNRQGRRYASVHVEAWQDQRQRLFAQATGHFLMPSRDG